MPRCVRCHRHLTSDLRVPRPDNLAAPSLRNRHLFRAFLLFEVQLILEIHSSLVWRVPSVWTSWHVGFQVLLLLGYCSPLLTLGPKKMRRACILLYWFSLPLLVLVSFPAGIHRSKPGVSGSLCPGHSHWRMSASGRLPSLPVFSAFYTGRSSKMFVAQSGVSPYRLIRLVECRFAARFC